MRQSLFCKDAFIVQEMEAFVNLLIFVLFAIIMNSSEDKKNVRRDEDEKYFILF